MTVFNKRAGAAGLGAALLLATSPLVLAQSGGNAGADMAMVTAETADFMADMSGANEVPPVDTGATGHVYITYDEDSMTLHWTVYYSGLSGPVVAAHFHGPAPEGMNAPPVIDICAILAEEMANHQDQAPAAEPADANAPAMLMACGPTPPDGDAAQEMEFSGTTTLTQEQYDQLTSGMWYVNLHTPANPNGEIRGQVVAVDAAD